MAVLICLVTNLTCDKIHLQSANICGRATNVGNNDLRVGEVAAADIHTRKICSANHGVGRTTGKGSDWALLSSNRVNDCAVILGEKQGT